MDSLRENTGLIKFGSNQDFVGKGVSMNDVMSELDYFYMPKNQPFIYVHSNIDIGAYNPRSKIIILSSTDPNTYTNFENNLIRSRRLNVREFIGTVENTTRKSTYQ